MRSYIRHLQNLLTQGLTNFGDGLFMGMRGDKIQFTLI